MKISIKGGGKGKGWSNYVTRKYIKLSKKERNKIMVLSGNTKIGDCIIKTSNYKDNSVTIVLSFKGKISNARARAVNEEFKKLFMKGFENDEYHYDAVLHQDTDNTHIHIRIPTKNLLTDTQLRLYYHSKHKNFINAIRDYLIVKFDLPKPTPEEKKVFNTESKKEKLIQMQRAKENRKNFNFSKKKGRDEAKKYIADYIAELHGSGFIREFEDLKEVIQSLDLEIVKIGKDFAGDFNYFTVKDNNTDKKIRLIGEIYNAEFWQHTREDREKQIANNRVQRESNARDQASIEDAKQRLDRELAKRQAEIYERYEASRVRSRKKKEQIRQNYKVYGNSDSNNVRSDSRNVNNNNSKEIGETNDRIRADIRSRAEERESILKRAREDISICDREERRHIPGKNREITEQLQQENRRARERAVNTLQKRNAAYRQATKTRGTLFKRIGQQQRSVQSKFEKYVKHLQRNQQGNTANIRNKHERECNSVRGRFDNIIKTVGNITKTTRQVIEVLKEKLMPRQEPKPILKPKPKPRGPGM